MAYVGLFEQRFPSAVFGPVGLMVRPRDEGIVPRIFIHVGVVEGDTGGFSRSPLSTQHRRSSFAFVGIVGVSKNTVGGK